MEYLLLGTGLQGTAIAFDLLHYAPGTEKLVIVDADQDSLTVLADRLGDNRVSSVCADVRDATTLAPLMEAADVTISAVNYWFNANLAALAVEGRSHFLDLGGNNDIVAQEFELNDQAAAQGVTVIPDCGLAPAWPVSWVTGWSMAWTAPKVSNSAWAAFPPTRCPP